MATPKSGKGVSLEVLGTCMTNSRPGSTHDAIVEYRHLWSFAQQAALVAVCDQDETDKSHYLIDDPERRAKRIAGHYADLYFKSSEKSKGDVQFYWVALAAFVVKDIVEAYRYAREDVLQHEWKDAASVARNSPMAELGSLGMTSDSPYQHVIRTYSALAKGNLWLFMDIYPWMWFFMQYGINKGGTLNRQRLEASLDERDWNTFQKESKSAVEELPFGPNWLARLDGRLTADPVYKKGGEFFATKPSWNTEGGYGEFGTAARFAHNYVKTHVKEYDKGYRAPASQYWGNFQEAYFVMESEHIELRRIISDKGASESIQKARNFSATTDVHEAYRKLIGQYFSKTKLGFMQDELIAIAQHEQVNVLQPLIYNDIKLKETMDLNHRFSRLTGGWISPQFMVVYSFSARTDDPKLKTTFDDPIGIIDRLGGTRKNLTNVGDRMIFVKKIAADFNGLMTEKRSYMEGELRKIQQWTSA